ncbi:RNA polymerase sigma-70 factor [Lutibacter maritimus]|uniref:RNA polymerase sigma-70 factor, ECF subfamily n=1 Tax=Lutibacter maritimus TaxID=593133 RepID=A0A1I6Q991_9FLAO|nr:RNA polymerase sigma-70 factor [Lutibacter maritimus]SFS49031.1 RNA polymerase sigma-70 factor, ECF subfamily [Lutibacter maritimus]
MRLNDSKILEKLKKEDYSGYRILFDQYYKPLCIYSLKYCDSFSQAEDIVQELFVKFWNDKLYMKLNGSIGPYLFKSVKNNTLLFIKDKGKYQFEDIENQLNQLMEDEIIDFENIEKEKIKIYQEIEALPEKCKEVFKAIVIENLKYKEVAEQLGVSVNTIKTHYSRALKQLRHSLDIIILLFLV